MKRLLKVILLIIILGVPVFWYLFLQTFGENEFSLETVEEDFLAANCQVSGITLFYTYQPIDTKAKNQFSRIKQIATSNGIEFDASDTSCISDTSYALYLVDWKNDLRGKYTYEILEVDRAIVEIDLLKLLKDKNGSSN